MDYYEPPDVDTDVNQDDGRARNIQQVRLGELLGSYDESTRSWVNSTDRLVVRAVLVDDLGGFELNLSGEFRLQILPCGSRGEDWRFFVPSVRETT